jgi:pimeloyl-ACP methyl ester carboxylesterase
MTSTNPSTTPRRHHHDRQHDRQQDRQGPRPDQHLQAGPVLAAALRAVAAVVAIVLVLAIAACTPRPATVGDRSAATAVPAGLPGIISLVQQTHVGGITCGVYGIGVTRRAGTRDGYRMRGRLCTHGAFTGKPVEVLIPGAGYTATYYDWPNPTYSYTNAATADGRVTLAVDLPGTGSSTGSTTNETAPVDHPDGTTLTYATEAWIVHQLVIMLRYGMFGVNYAQVYLTGTSVGGYIAWVEADRYRDIAGLVLLDAAHSRQPGPAAALQRQLVDTATDPRFANLDWAGSRYLAPRAGSRCGSYYWAAGVDPLVCAEDEHLDATAAVPRGLITGIAAATAPSAVAEVGAPVLVVLGDHDALYCGRTPCSAPGSPARGECGLYRAAASCTLWVQPDAGHLELLHRSAPALFAELDRWFTERHSGIHPSAHTTWLGHQQPSSVELVCRETTTSIPVQGA